MPVIERRILIPAPPERVWDVLADVPSQPRWMRDLKAIRFEDPTPESPASRSGSRSASREGTPGSTGSVGVGTRAVGTVRMFGIEQSDVVEVDVFDPPHRFGLRHLGRFAGRGDFWLTPVPGGATRVRWREELRSPLARLGRPGRLVDALFARVFELVFRADLRRLRDLVVSDGRAAGTPRRGRPTGEPGGGQD